MLFQGKENNTDRKIQLLQENCSLGSHLHWFRIWKYFSLVREQNVNLWIKTSQNIITIGCLFS